MAWRSLSSRDGPQPLDAAPAAVLASDARLLEAELAERAGDTEVLTAAEPATGPGSGWSPADASGCGDAG